MPTIRFNGVPANMYLPGSGSGIDRALFALERNQFVLLSATTSAISVLLLDDRGNSLGTEFTIRGRFNLSSPSAALGSTISSFQFFDGDTELISITGVNQTVLGLIRSVNSLLTTGSSDTLIGSALADVLAGERGNDRLLGGGGGDALLGGAGNDALDGQFAGGALLVGGTGDDTYTVGLANVVPADSIRDVVVERDNGGNDLVLSHASWVLPQYVERLTLLGTAGLDGTGNSLNNLLVGNTGDNTLDGHAGADTMTGEAGNDTYVVDSSADVVNELLDQGIDLVRSSATSYVLGLNLEALALIGSADINATGNGLANTLTGNDGDNRLDGMGGADSMIGGMGDDTYVVDNVDDRVDDSGGIDTVIVNRSINLATDFVDIENATLSGTSALSTVGTDGDNVLTGNTGANTLTGGLGSDVLDGKAGADSMDGGLGNDAYYVDALGDQIVEIGGFGSGNDTVYSSITYSLVGREIESLVLLGTAALTATGNTFANSLTGNSGANRLDGGTGADTMAGGAGNDTYVVDDSDDRVVEIGSQGIDTVLASVSIALGDNVEILTLNTARPASLTGNAIVNTITGNIGADTLDGGAGNDTLKGGLGDDVYRVDSTTDLVTELVNQGNDRVEASASFMLGLNVEALTLTGSAGIDATGNGLANTLTGNNGNNRLDGMGGADAMIGGLGDDTYVVDNVGDSVADSSGVDTVVINRSVNLTTGFTEIENVTLSGTGAFFATGTIGDNRLIGNAAANTLTGAGGDDYFDGGAGADSMFGGTGDDTYVIDSVGDRITDSAGVNTLRSSIGINLNGASFNAIAEAVLLGSAALNAQGSNRADRLTGNSGANRLDGDAGADTMTGAAGNDTYVVDDAGDTIVEQLNQGIDTVLTSVGGITLADNVEILTLTAAGAASLIGNDIANTITGNIGDDTLDGGAGNDTLKGGTGDDTYVVDSALDVVTETLVGVAGGSDLVRSSASFVLGLNVEALTLTGSADLNATGNALANTLTGNNGNNRLDGAGGADTMTGALGDDTYVVDNVGDSFADSGGVDTVVINRSVNLTTGFTEIENVTLSGTGAFFATGTIGDNRLIGNAGANTLTGAGGDDYFDGGAGADSMIGGTGNDTYVIDSIGDRITDTAGVNTVRSSIGVNLNGADFSAIAEVVLLGGVALNALGSNRADHLTGNSGANKLDGGGNADTMTGAAGNDTYIVDDGGDAIVELIGQGTDTVLTSVGITLADNVEVVTLTTVAGASLIGNSIANTITGNAGDDTLDGGAGNDTLKGGAGDDTYVVDSALDVVTETLAGAAGGIDLVRSSMSFVLGTNVEALTLTGSADINATGNGLANTLTGNDGDNLLNGLGGADTMIGGSGDDTYFIDNVRDVVTESAGGGSDTVVFTALRDVINSLGLAVFQNIYLNPEDDHAFGGNIENVRLTGTANFSVYGNGRDNHLVGNSASNFLGGYGGNDLLDGGPGGDGMEGGAGNDTYIIDSIDDRVVDNQGVNEVRSYIALSLTRSDLLFVSDLVFLGNGARYALGNDLANHITSGSGDDTLVGGLGDDTLDGGAGADTLLGGPGDDIYVDVDASDLVVETANGGIDRVQSFESVSLGETLFEIEAVELLGSANTFAIGDANSNVLRGNTGDNLIDGGNGNDTLASGGGADTLIGGAGDDVYDLGDDLQGMVLEQAGGGTDTVRATISLILGNFAFIENVGLTGTTNADLVGTDGVNVLTGNAGDNLIDGAGGADTMNGGTGDDTYLVNDIGDRVTDVDGGVDLVRTSVSFTASLDGSVELIEAIGSADVTLRGDSANNRITGNSGNNMLDGVGGDDTLIGGLGDDTYVLSSASIVEAADEGTDTVSGVIRNIALSGSLANIENAVVDPQSSPDGFISLAGNANANRLTGGPGRNYLDGGVGADTLIGGAGDDQYQIDDAGDQVVEAPSQGYDVLFSRISLDLRSGFANIERFELGGPGNLTLRGNDAANELVGNDGANRIDGGGGADTMSGNSGDDTYIVDSAQDQVTDSQGDDSVEASVSYVMPVGIERLQLTGSASIGGTGNQFNDSIVGNSGNNTLRGLDGNDTLFGGQGNDSLVGGLGDDSIDGGPGADTMVGGDGNDTYAPDDPGDVVVELGNQGFDTLVVHRSVNLVTEGIRNIEAVQLTGSNDLSITGDNGLNRLYGNAGANRIDGGGQPALNPGDAADQMAGGDGNDTYVVDSILDLVSESSPFTGQITNGQDLVESSVSYQLSDNIERLLLTGGADLSGTGSAGDNVITGNAGNNRLYGGRLDGADTLFGGAGNDSLAGGSGVDMLSGGEGDDVLDYDMDGDSLLDGGSGHDVLRISNVAGNMKLDLSLPGETGNEGRFRSLEAIDLTGNGFDSLEDLGWQQILTLSDDDRLIVDGNAGDIVTSLAGQGWLQGADQTIGANLYNTWTSNGATLVIDTDVTFTPL